MLNESPSSSNKRRRTSEDFLAFCRIILDYENYEGRSSNGVGASRKQRIQQQKNGVEVGNEVEEDETEDSKSSTSSSDGRDKDGFNEVTCYCNKPFAGRPMIECSSCLTWIHLSCAKIKRTHIPDTWNCSKCLDKLASSSSPSPSSNTSSSSTNAAKRSRSRKRKTSPSQNNSAINLTL